MNIIFLTISHITSISDRGIYTDLMRKFRDEGHNVYIVTPRERKYNIATSLIQIDGVHILGVKTLNIQKTNIIEKGISTLLLEHQFKSAINHNLPHLKIDLILYSTPPITFVGVIKQLKRTNPQAKSYLLLKDIFPQNAVDLGMLSKCNPLYWYFRFKECRLYKISDNIGCMSPANMQYILKHNTYLRTDIVSVAPNSIELSNSLITSNRVKIREYYKLPINKPIFIYGGNLGKPQDVSYIIQCLDAIKHRNDLHILIVGSGTEYQKLDNWLKYNKTPNITLMSGLPKADYDKLVSACDVGLIFLDHRFTIPNFPSRLLSYLENKMPIIAATDNNTDIGIIAEKNGFGYSCQSINTDDFVYCINKFTDNSTLITQMGQCGYDYLINNYLVNDTYNAIIKYV